MDQGVIVTLKAYYQCRRMSQLVNTTDSPEKLTIKQFWANYIMKAIDTAWKEVIEKNELLLEEIMDRACQAT